MKKKVVTLLMVSLSTGLHIHSKSEYIQRIFIIYNVTVQHTGKMLYYSTGSNLN